MREVANVRAVAPVAIRTESAVSGNQNHSTQVMGTDNSYFIARDWSVAQGRLFLDAEVRAGRTVCIVGQTLRASLFGAQNPLGTDIRVGAAPCEVIGVLEVRGQSTFGQDQDDVVVMPIRAMQRRITGNTNVGMVWIAGARAEDVPKIIGDVTQLMRERREESIERFQTYILPELQQLSHGELPQPVQVRIAAGDRHLHGADRSGSLHGEFELHLRIAQGRVKPLWKIGHFWPAEELPVLDLADRKSTRLNSSHSDRSRMPSSA